MMISDVSSYLLQLKPGGQNMALPKPHIWYFGKRLDQLEITVF